jgi:hypothetical protein
MSILDVSPRAYIYTAHTQSGATPSDPKQAAAHIAAAAAIGAANGVCACGFERAAVMDSRRAID